MLGPLHIEMAGWSTVDVLDGSGQTSAFSDSGMTSSGTADSFLKCSHLKGTRYTHEVTCYVIRKLQIDAYETYSHNPNVHDSFIQWQ